MPTYKYICIDCGKKYSKEFFSIPPLNREDKGKQCETCSNREHLAKIQKDILLLKKCQNEKILKLEDRVKTLEKTVKLLSNKNKEQYKMIESLENDVIDLEKDTKRTLRGKIDQIMEKRIKKAEEKLAETTNKNKERHSSKTKKDNAMNKNKQIAADISSIIVSAETTMEQAEGIRDPGSTGKEHPENRFADEISAGTDYEEVSNQNTEGGDFIVVKNPRQTRNVTPIRKVEFRNTYQILETTDDQAFETPALVPTELVQKQAVVVGDFIIQNQENGFGFKNLPTRKVICNPHANIKSLTKTMKEMPLTNTLIVQAGYSSVHEYMSEEYLNRFHNAIRQAKNTAKNVVVNSIIPRLNTNGYEYSKIRYLNRGIEGLCKREDITFCDTFRHFDKKMHLFEADGLHLNEKGEYILATILNREIANISPEEASKQNQYLNWELTGETRIT